jgi:hypothetical protein
MYRMPYLTVYSDPTYESTLDSFEKGMTSYIDSERTNARTKERLIQMEIVLQGLLTSVNREINKHS